MSARVARLGDGAPALVLIALAVLLPAVVSAEYVLLAASMIVTMLVAVSFNLLFGYTGMFSFGQAVFYGLGAYTTALLMNHAGTSFYLAIVGGIAIAVLAGLLSGAVLVGLEPIAFIMLTFALGDLLEFVAEHARGLTGGDSGLIVSLPSSLNVVADVNGVYYAMLAAAVVALAVAFGFVKTTPGLMVRGIREDPLRARTLGIAVNRRRLGVFTLSAGIAAVGGGCSVLSAQIVYPDVFDWRVSANALIITLIGGAGLFSGPVLGAVLLGLIDFYVGRLTTDTLLVEGGLLLAVILIAPRGVTALGRSGGDGAPAAPAVTLRRLRVLFARAGDGDDRKGGVLAVSAASPLPPAPPPPRAASALELRGVSKRFGGIRALEGVSLSVEAGSTVAVIGPNGAGKSTLFALVSGELQPSEGTILLAGRDLRRLSVERRASLGLGRTFQSARLFAGLTVRENVELALVRRGRREDEVKEALAEVRLLELLDRRAGALAQGERKRLELAMVLAQRPRLLLLDEPTAGMGAEERVAIMELIVGAIGRRGLTMVFTEHDMDTVFAHARRIVVLDRGAVIADGSPQTVRADERVQEIYLGSAA